MPRSLRTVHETNQRYTNREGAHYMRTIMADRRQDAVRSLAALAGCSGDELIITRNTTESLDLIISGFPWKAGDEAVMAHQDYGAMLDMFRQVARRHGVVNKLVSVPPDPLSDEEVVEIYRRAITPRTRLLMVCHIINITGHVLPVRKIADMAHAHGVQVMVDGAHAFAHLDFDISSLGADYYGCSLHKWLSAPLGAGMLYIRRQHIPHIWPLFADEGKQPDDVLRLNHTGTYPVATDLTIPHAVSHYLDMGPQRKQDRLRFLRHYWVSQVQHMPHIVFNSPTQEQRTCAIVNVGVKGMKPADLAKLLMDKYGIYTVAIDNIAAGVQGVRITPNVFTTTAELDTLVVALSEIRA